MAHKLSGTGLELEVETDIVLFTSNIHTLTYLAQKGDTKAYINCACSIMVADTVWIQEFIERLSAVPKKKIKV